MKKKNIIIMTISLSIILLFGTSYALLKVSKNSNNYVIDLGNLQVEFEEGKTEVLSLENAKPLNDTDGLKESKALSFIIKNNGSVDATYNVYIEDDKITYEYAALAYNSVNDYYYYGPYSGEYKLNFGEIEANTEYDGNFFFNIIDGEVTLLHFDNVCTKSDGLPGEDGYEF